MLASGSDWAAVSSLVLQAINATKQNPSVGNVVDVWLRSSEPLLVALGIMVIVTFVTWIMTLITKNVSQIDRLWSILPPFYAYVFAGGLGGMTSFQDRLFWMRVLPTMWGMRLTYNFWRKGGYGPEGEDYRWPELRKIIHPILFQIFNLFFIAIFQCILLLLIASPAFIASHSRAPLNNLDYACIATFLILLTIETVADQQQWVFQNEKYRLRKLNKPLTGDYALGFRRSGLFRYSRHPNFFAEISIWWVYYFFSVAATGEWLNWTIAGTALLTLLFQGSTTFTEQLTLRKYKAYADYQRTTSRLIPWFPSTGSKSD